MKKYRWGQENNTNWHEVTQKENVKKNIKANLTEYATVIRQECVTGVR